MIKPYSTGATGQSGRSAPPLPAGGRSATSAIHGPGNAMVLAAIASVILSTIIGVAWITPLLQAGAVSPFFYVAMRNRGAGWSLVLVVRWAAAVLVASIVVGAFAPARMDASQLLSVKVASTLEAWLTSAQAPPPADYSYLLWGMAIFLVGSVISGGFAGFVAGSVALGGAASGALLLFENGGNVVQITLTALPPWQLGLFAGCALLLVPAATPFFDRFIGLWENDRKPLRIYMYAGAACFVLSVLLRLTTTGVWHQILKRWTVF